MAFGRDGTSRTAHRTDFTGFIGEVKTVGFVVRIFFRRGFEG
jgi:hypothetical protein